MNLSMPMGGGSTPRYIQVARTLYEEISANRYPVGSRLPTEHELCEQFGVSRFTVREAIKLLVRQGMVTRQPGVGSRVQATVPASQYVQTMSGISDLSQYAVDTSLEVLRSCIEPIDAQTAENLCASEGETWLRIEGLRFAKEQALPMAHTTVYVAPRFRSIMLPTARLAKPLYIYIEEQYGARVDRVTQEIRAVALDAAVSKALGVVSRSPGLWLKRDYLDEHGGLLEKAISIHPYDRFTYRESFRRDYHAAKER